MDHGFTKPRRTAQWSPRGEQLEGRALLTGAGGNTFALVPGSIDKPGDSASETFKINPAQFTIPSKMVLGVDVAAASPDSAASPASAASPPPLKPTISAVGAVNPTTAATAPAESLSPLALTRTTGSTAVLVPIQPRRGQATAQAYEATVTGDAGATGKFLVGYYLPGDVDGDGQVSQKDIKAITAALGSKAGDAQYNFEADSNRDGKIDPQDLDIARQNLGVQTKIQASLTTNLDPASDSGTADRITVYRDAIFEGNATPGAQLTFSEVNQKTPDFHTTVKPDGTYALTIPLAEGVNTFKLTSTDSFGQQISGTLTPVTYQKPATPVTSPTKATNPPKPLYPATTTTNTPTTLPVQGRTNRLAPNSRHAAPRGDQAAKLRARLASLQDAKPTTPVVPTSGTGTQGIAVGEPAPGTTAPVTTTKASPTVSAPAPVVSMPVASTTGTTTKGISIGDPTSGATTKSITIGEPASGTRTPLAPAKTPSLNPISAPVTSTAPATKPTPTTATTPAPATTAPDISSILLSR